jgi:hypothetical protein
MAIIRAVVCAVGLTAAVLGILPASAETIVDEWASVKAPPAPA